MEQLRNCTYFTGQLVRQSHAIFQRVSTPLRQISSFFGQAKEVHPDRGGQLTDAVMQFTSDVSSLFIAHLQQARGKLSHHFALLLESRVVCLEFACTLFDREVQVLM